MWNRTAFTEQLGIRYPIVQGPFGGGASTAALVVAVSNAGGLGCFGANTLSAEQITKVAEDIRNMTDKPFAFNLWVNPSDEPRACSADLARALEWMAPYYRELGIEPPPPPERFTEDHQAQAEAVLAANHGIGDKPIAKVWMEPKLDGPLARIVGKTRQSRLGREQLPRNSVSPRRRAAISGNGPPRADGHQASKRP